jgi:hypothetical protein
MVTLEILSTVKRGKQNEHFLGTITFRTDSKPDLLFNWTIIDPNKEEFKLELLKADKAFIKIEGPPTPEMVNALSENQQTILSLGVETIIDVIDNSARLLSHNSTQVVELFADLSGEGKRVIDIDKAIIELIFL